MHQCKILIIICIQTMLFVQKSTKAVTWARGTPCSAGVDLCSAENVLTTSKSYALISTGLIVKIPVGCYERITPIEPNSLNMH